MNKNHTLSFFVVVSITIAFSLLCSCTSTHSARMEGGSDEPDRPMGRMFEGEEPGEESDSGSEIEWKYGMSLDGGSIKNHGAFCNGPGPFSGYTPEGLVKHVAEIMRFVTPVVAIHCNNGPWRPSGVSPGSGLVVDLGGGNMYLLSCAHVFEDGRAEVKTYAKQLHIRIGHIFYNRDYTIRRVGADGSESFIYPFSMKTLRTAMKEVGEMLSKKASSVIQTLSTSEKEDNYITLQRLPGNNGNIYDGGDSNGKPFCPDECSFCVVPVACDMVWFNLNGHCPGPFFPEMSSYVRLAYVDFSVDSGGELVIGNGMRFNLCFLQRQALVVVPGYPSTGPPIDEKIGFIFRSKEGDIAMGRLIGLRKGKHGNSDYTVVHYSLNTKTGHSGGPIFILIPVNGRWIMCLMGDHTHKGINTDECGRSGLAFSESIYEMILGLSSPEFKEFNKHGPKEEFLREEAERKEKDVEDLLSRFSETMQDNFVNPDEALRLWTSNCCFADAALKILTESGAIGDDIYESKDEICRLIATFIDLNRSGKPFPNKKMQELLRLYEISEGSIYGFEQQEWCFHFFRKISKRLFTECELFKKKFELCYDASCRCPLTVTHRPDATSLFFSFNEKYVDCKKKISRRALNRPPCIAVGSSESLCEEEFENIKVQYKDGPMLHYELKSFVAYSGDGDSGHYSAYAKLEDGNYWKYDTLGTTVNSTSRGDACQEFKNNLIAIYKRRV